MPICPSVDAQEYLQGGSTAEYRVGGPDSDIVQWQVVAPAITAGSNISLRYNTAAGPFAGMRPEAGTAPVLVIGHNNWEQSRVSCDWLGLGLG